MKADTAVSAPLCIIAVLMLAVVAWFAGSVFAPLATALFVMALVWPFQEALQTRMPQLAALALTLLFTLGVAFVFGSLVIWAVGRVGRSIMMDAARYELMYQSAADWLDGQGISIAGMWAEHFDSRWMITAARYFGGRVQTTMVFWIIVVTYLLLGLLEVGDFRRKIAAMENREAARVLLDGSRIIASKYRRYLKVRTMMSALTGLLVWAFARIVGLPHANEWGIIAFALNYLPSSNRGICKRRFVRGRLCREHGRLRGRHRPPHHGASQGGPSNVHYAYFKPGLVVQRQLRNGPAYVPAGTPRHAMGAVELDLIRR